MQPLRENAGYKSFQSLTVYKHVVIVADLRNI